MAITVKITTADGSVNTVEVDASSPLKINPGDSVELVGVGSEDVQLETSGNNLIVTVDGEPPVVFEDFAVYMRNPNIDSAINFGEGEDLTEIATIDDLDAFSAAGLEETDTAAGGDAGGAGADGGGTGSDGFLGLADAAGPRVGANFDEGPGTQDRVITADVEPGVAEEDTIDNDPPSILVGSAGEGHWEESPEYPEGTWVEDFEGSDSQTLHVHEGALDGDEIIVNNCGTGDYEGEGSRPWRDGEDTDHYRGGDNTMLQITDPDGLEDVVSITINGKTVALADIGDTEGTATEFTGSNGTLYVWSYDATSGAAHYVYELTEAADHELATHSTEGEGDADILENGDVLTLTVTDAAGATSVPATIFIDIIDDIPHARNNRDSITEDGDWVPAGEGQDGYVPAHYVNFVDGSVVNNDRFGADDENQSDDAVPVDAPVVGVAEGEGANYNDYALDAGVGDTIYGQYGTLVMAADGDYTYTLYVEQDVQAAQDALDNLGDGASEEEVEAAQTNLNQVTTMQAGYAALQALDAGDTSNDVFSYTIMDGDGDTDTAKLTINVSGINDAPEFFEPEDSDPDPYSIVVNEDSSYQGSASASDWEDDADNVDLSYTIVAGEGPTNGSVDLDPATGLYTYTPDADYGGTGGSSEDSFQVKVTDSGGLTDYVTVNVDIQAVADAPTLQMVAQEGSTTNTHIEYESSTSTQTETVDLDNLTYVKAYAAGSTIDFSNVTNTGGATWYSGGSGYGIDSPGDSTGGERHSVTDGEFAVIILDQVSGTTSGVVHVTLKHITGDTLLASVRDAAGNEIAVLPIAEASNDAEITYDLPFTGNDAAYVVITHTGDGSGGQAGFNIVGVSVERSITTTTEVEIEVIDSYVYTIDVSAAATDTDGSEDLSVVSIDASTIPAGSIITDATLNQAGTHYEVTLTNGEGSFMVTTANAVPLTDGQLNDISGSVTSTEDTGDAAVPDATTDATVLIEIDEGTSGQNTINGTAADEYIEAGDGKDTVIAGGGDDTIYGGEKNDTIDGGDGNDTMTGGSGNDNFVLSGGNDVITDFTTGDDLALGDVLIGDVTVDTTEGNADVVITYDSDPTAGVSMSTLTLKGVLDEDSITTQSGDNYSNSSDLNDALNTLLNSGTLPDGTV